MVNGKWIIVFSEFLSIPMVVRRNVTLLFLIANSLKG